MSSSQEFVYVKGADTFFNMNYIHSMKHRYESDGNPCFEVKVVLASIRFGHSYTHTFQVCKKEEPISYRRLAERVWKISSH